MRSKFIIRNRNRGNPLEIKVTTFPGGEINTTLDISKLDSVVTVTAWLKDSDGLIVLSQLKSILDSRQVPIVNLVLGYVPYARQDRICNVGESLAIKVFTSALNNLKFNNVLILDPHSDVTPALINNITIRTKEAILSKLPTTFDYFIAPDAGASKEVEKLARTFNTPFVQGTKERDTVTGNISNFNVYTQYDLKGKDLLIIDDICDGGGTFIGLANVLQDSTPKSISLYVTHGMFTKGTEGLLRYFDTIYTTNSYLDNIQENNSINCIYKL